MDFAEFQRLVDAFVVQHGRLALPYGIQLLDEELKASDDDLSDVESRLRVRLPMAYKEVMKVYGVGPFVFVDLIPVRPSPKRIGDLAVTILATLGLRISFRLPRSEPATCGDSW